jgi:hypothetical protein
MPGFLVYVPIASCKLVLIDTQLFFQLIGWLLCSFELGSSSRCPKMTQGSPSVANQCSKESAIAPI